MTQAYEASSIKILKGLEAVRKRPGMYIGDTGENGLHHCLWEIVDNSLDEAVAGHGKHIRVTLHADGSASVSDDGRGIPVDLHPEEGVSAATLAMTVLHAGGKFGGDGSAYHRSGGLHGVGASVVNALSSRFDLTVYRQGYTWHQRFLNGGHPESALYRGERSDKTGTTIRFWPDTNVFMEDLLEEDDQRTRTDYTFVRDRVVARLELLSYLNPGLELLLTDEREGEIPTQTWCAKAFSGYLDVLCAGQCGATVLSDREHQAEGKTANGSISVRFAFRLVENETSALASFVNNIKTPWGGTHEAGFKSALLRSLNQYGSDNDLIKNPLSSEDVREGLIAAISVRMDEPKFEGQTKEKLGSKEAQGAVSSTVYQYLMKFLEENPKEGREWINRAQRAARAREAAKKAREQVNSAKDINSAIRLPGKLADCRESRPELIELFIVEGDSAGGSAKQARDREYQAILPAKGKILNTHKAKESDVFSNGEVFTVMNALGYNGGTLKEPDIEKLRYHRVVIMTDADVDGAHIRTLFLTFFHNYMPFLLEGGYVYAAMPPLYKMRLGKKILYVPDDQAKEKILKESPGNWVIERFKGLGEMDPGELWDTTMNPATRRMQRISYESSREDADLTFEMLMGVNVPPRRAFIEDNALYADVDA